MCDEKLPAVKRYKAHVNFITGSTPIFCQARKLALTLQDRVKQKLDTMVWQGILKLLQPGGVIKASPVFGKGKKIEL